MPRRDVTAKITTRWRRPIDPRLFAGVLLDIAAAQLRREAEQRGKTADDRVTSAESSTDERRTDRD